MFQRSGAGLRRAAVLAAVVAGIGMMATAGSATAADKDHGPNDYAAAAATNCSVVQDWSYYRKCGDTGSEHEARAEVKHAREPQPPADNEPTGAAAAPSRE
jgi:hypothetical protein